MAIAPGVSSKGRASSAATIASTGVTTQASGSTFVVVCFWGGAATFTSLVDSKGNTYAQINTAITIAAADNCRMYYVENGVGGASHTATLTISGAQAIGVMFIEITGGLKVGILDQQDRRDDVASPYTLAAGLTTTQADELLVTSFVGNSGSNPATNAESGLGSSAIQAGTEETNGSTFFASAIAVSVKSATGTFNPSWTQSGSNGGATWLQTFKAATASIGARRGKGPARGPKAKNRILAHGTRSFTFSPVTNLSASIDAGQVTLAGQSFTSTIGVPVTNGQVTLAGQSFTTSINTPVNAGAVSVAGQSFSTSIGVPITAGAVTLTGQTVTSAIGLNVPITAGEVAITGQPFTSSISVPIAAGTVTFAGFDIDAQITGGDLSVLIEAGQIVMTGQAFTSGVTGAPDDDPPEEAPVEQPTGGGLYLAFEQHRARRQRDRRERERREDEARAIQNEIDREIAQLLRVQEARDAERADLSRIQELADQYAGRAMREGVSRRASAAILKAHEERSFNALMQMQRELERMYEEEEALSFLMLDDD